MASPTSARDNIVSPLKKLALIDDGGSLTPLGSKWRVDTSYDDACDEIIAAVYPDELAALTAADGDPDSEQVKTWFDHKGFGDSNAQKMANTYILIASKTVPETPSGEPAKKAAAKKAKRAPTVRASEGTKPAVATPLIPPIRPPLQGGPSLHIDIQIHVPADVDSEQIDQIFASMAKHLYPQQAGE